MYLEKIQQNSVHQCKIKCKKRNLNSWNFKALSDERECEKLCRKSSSSSSREYRKNDVFVINFYDDNLLQKRRRRYATLIAPSKALRNLHSVTHVRSMGGKKEQCVYIRSEKWAFDGSPYSSSRDIVIQDTIPVSPENGMEGGWHPHSAYNTRELYCRVNLVIFVLKWYTHLIDDHYFRSCKPIKYS